MGIPALERTAMTKLLSVLVLLALPSVSTVFAATNTNAPALLLLVGAPGGPEYASNFVQQAALWNDAAAKAGCSRVVTIGLDAAPAETAEQPDQTGRRDKAGEDVEKLQRFLESEPKDDPTQLWLVLIGHGTFDGKEAKFNLRGPDLSSTNLSAWLKPFHRPMVIINTSSSSAPFINTLSATNRVTITATRSGHEQYFTRFGRYFAENLADLKADLDKDEQVSLLEAFLAASRQVGEFYKVEGRIATEHALVDDNGDALGTPAEWFRGLRATKKAQDKAAVDGLRARQLHLIPSDADRLLTPEQRARRDSLERAVLQHRERKEQMPEDDYYRELERLLLDLAGFYEALPPK
jgi:hypothetical protein